MAKSKQPAAAGPAGKGLEVTAKRESFWRGGLQFTREARTVPLDSITEAQAEAIRAEGDGGMLVVVEVDLKAEKADGAK